MAIEEPTHRVFYRRLLMLYPKPFRERFGESMEQTFDDLCNERGAKVMTLTIRLSVDTGIGIVKEQVLHLSQRRVMTGIFSNPRTTAVIGFLLALPGALLLSGMIFGLQPALGPVAAYVQNGPGPHLFGSLLALTLIVILPVVGLLINAATIRKALFEYKNLALAAAAGLALVAPWMILERVNQPNAAFPFALFAVMWLLAALFVAILLPIVGKVRAGNGLSAHLATFLLGAFVLFIIAAMWGGLLVDQMPCFLGVPNCD